MPNNAYRGGDRVTLTFMTCAGEGEEALKALEKRLRENTDEDWFCYVETIIGKVDQV